METHSPLFSIAYLQSIWAKDYDEFKNSPHSDDLYARLKNWAGKDWQKETSSEIVFIDLFFKQTWCYFGSGERDKNQGFTIQQQYPVKRAGQKGGTGKADIALGFFGQKDVAEIPQVLGEFKDDRSGLDKPQTNRPNDRSPVEQCIDYLRESRTGLISSVLPTWGLVTDMNEFRLYFYGNKAQYQRFVIKPSKSDIAISLLGNDEESAFQRFLFYRFFNSEWLLSSGGKSKLEKLMDEQILQEQALENQFYSEYHSFREEIYLSLRQLNPQYYQNGRLSRLVKYTQRILDRCIFILYCEDMGRKLNFPPNILRDVLIEVSTSKFYNPDAEDAWTKVKALFASMRDGSPFGNERINRFNGGLFDDDPEMNTLRLPNRVFCEKNQGQSQTRLLQYPKTLLYFSSKYNFGTSDGGNGKTLTLTAMGRIFEQSITDLEVMEAHAENRNSLTTLTKRKRDGVYYTPEWVTLYIVEGTLGVLLRDIRKELGFDTFTDVTEEQIKMFIEDRRKSKIVGKYEKALHEYSERLDKLKVVDPACGSGAFLIQAFIYLYEQRQWVAKELERVTRVMGLFDIHENMRSVLSKNLYGVDINAESIELTRLALWLYTALPDRPLTSLDRNIRCGNSLVSHDFYSQEGNNRELFSEDQSERINTFDWVEAFPDVFKGDDPGFDCVIGNPPYVKLQYFRKIQEDVANYLIKAKRPNGEMVYESTQTGNFDIYLPFIERGLELLNKQGKMGYIAPSVWLMNEYGNGLRQKLKRIRSLDRWIDFKSFQVFSEATTYTAMQFFTASPQDNIQCFFAPNGRQDIASLDWYNVVNDSISYDTLSNNDSWQLIPAKEKQLIQSLSQNNDPLSSVVENISQGLISGAYWVFVNSKLSEGRYLHSPKQPGQSDLPLEIEIEEKITLKLVSGEHIKRYQMIKTDLRIIFPYTKSEEIKLYDTKTMENEFPKTWEFLKSYETFLRQRDGGKLNDDYWYRYSRNQNLDKQQRPKLMIAGTAKSILCTVDEKGEFAANDKRVYSIFSKKIDDLWFLSGILNSPVATFVFRRIARPKAGGYYDIESQFLAPLPIPKVSDEEKNQTIGYAKKLQALHTLRRDLLLDIDKRIESSQCEDDTRDVSWLWADVKSVNDIKKNAPPKLNGRELTTWAKSIRELKIGAHLEKIDLMLHEDLELNVVCEGGELKIMAKDMPLIEGIFLSEDDELFIASQWRQMVRQKNITDKFNSKSLINMLLRLRKTNNPAIKEQVVKIDKSIQSLDKEIELLEKDINQLTYRLYKLSNDEIQLVEDGRLNLF